LVSAVRFGKKREGPRHELYQAADTSEVRVSRSDVEARREYVEPEQAEDKLPSPA
jgi:hypothetical protein